MSAIHSQTANELAQECYAEADRLERENIYSAQGITRDWLRSVGARIEALQPDGPADTARPLLEQVRREWYRYTSYSQLKADIDHYLDERYATSERPGE